MKKLILPIGLLAFLSVGLMFQPFNAQAASIGDLEQKQESIKDKKSNLDKETQEKQSEIDKLEEQKKDASKDLNELLENIEKTNLKLKKQQEAVTKEKQEIKRIADKIQALKKEIKARQEVLNERARTLQKNGTADNYLSLLMDSDDFSDLIDRVGIVTTIVKADKTIMDEQNRDKNDLKDTQEKEKKQLAKVKQLAEEVKIARNNMESQKLEKNDLILNLAKKKHLSQSEKATLESQKGSLNEAESQVASALTSEKSRIAEAKRQAEAEKKAAKAADESKQQTVQQHDTVARSAGSSSSSTEKTADNSGNGMFIKPAAGMLTSPFSDRTNPVTGQHESHKGQDIATGGTVPIHAAASGTVVFAGFGVSGSGYGGYGYVVEINHGNGYQTLYGHMKAGSLKVTAGQHVSQGQEIGIMGATGQATGQHLHFEIHKNGVPVNPAPYL